VNIDLLRRLNAAPGVAGFEHRVPAVVAEELAPLVDEMRVDRLGNLIATRHGTGGPTVLVAAHMDEIGSLVRHIDERGFLRLQPLGSFDPRVLLTQRVIVHTADDAQVPGVIETTVDPLHFGPPVDPKRPDLRDFFVDVGPGASQIEIGDMVTLDRDEVAIGERVVSKALDDRLDLYVIIEAVRELSGQKSTIVAVATTQEEVGSRGAVVAGYNIDPDICVALDLTLANDIPGVTPDQEVARLGAGPAIKVMDTTQISHPGIVRHFRDLARQHDIPYQLEVLSHGGTDASLIQRLRAGVAVVTLSIPARYIHTVNETVAITDVDHSVTLLTSYLQDAHTRQYTAGLGVAQGAPQRALQRACDRGAYGQARRGHLSRRASWSECRGEVSLEKTVLGDTGLRVSRIGLGGYPFSGVNRARNWDPYSAAGRLTVIATIHRALDLGINYIDTAPGYGDGHSERLIGEVMRTRRDECVLATKVGWKGLDKVAVKESVLGSLERLGTPYVDVAQFHGGMYTEEDYAHIVHGGPLEALRELRQSGEVRFIGLTAEEPWTTRPFLESGEFQVVQLAYNLIYQSAALHILDEARRRGIGVVTMRTMTSGILQHILTSLAPEWPRARDPYEVCLDFVLSDPRVHVALVGMRWPEEVEHNVRLVEAFDSPLDVSAVPRLTAGIYGTEDAEADRGGSCD